MLTIVIAVLENATETIGSSDQSKVPRVDPLALTAFWMSVISAMAAAAAAIANWLSVASARSIHEAQVLVSLIEKYRSPEMNAAFKAMVDWSNAAHPDALTEWNQARMAREEWALVLDNHRRRIKGYFETVATLLRGRFIRRRVAVAAVDHGGVRIFFEPGEAMDRAINPANYPKWIWDTIRPLPVQFDVGENFDRQD